MSQLDHLLNSHTVSSWRPVAWSIMALLAFFLLWAMFAKLDEVAIAQGEVVPQGRIKTIQHLEGGIIDEIYVNEGDSVRKGAPLVQLDLAGTVTNIEELQVSLDGLRLSKARLEAEADGTDLLLPEDLSQLRPKLTSAELAAYEARRKELISTRAVLKGQVLQRTQDGREVQARLTATTVSLSLARERLGMSADLMRDQLQSPMEHLRIKSEVEALQGEVASLNEALPRAAAALAEAQERVQELDLRFSREAREKLGTVELNIARNLELLVTATEQQTRTTIRSPTNGIVKNMRYTTIGGVVRSGESIMDIVPSEEQLVIEARLDPMDRGFVRAGQLATVKIDTYDFARYGGIDGEVINVAPDSTVPDNAPPYFKVIVRTKTPWLGEEEDGLMIAPGMGSTIDIHTGTKSVMEYLIRPVLKLKHESFRER